MGVRVRQKADGWYIHATHKGQRKAQKCLAGEKSANKLALQIAAQLDRGNLSFFQAPVAPVAVPTFAEVAQDWLTWRKGLRGKHARPNTEERHADSIRVHLGPCFQGPITDVTFKRIEEFIILKRAGDPSRDVDPLKDSTFQGHCSTLRQILDYAVRGGLLPTQPFDRVYFKPSPRAKLPDPFTQDELGRILAAAEAVSPVFAVMLRAGAQSGMRPGELRGLQRGDLDSVKGTVAVSRNLDKYMRVGPTKTLRSTRTASIILPTCEAVTGWQPTEASSSVLARLAHVTPLDANAPLFPSLSDPAKAMTTSELRYQWGRVLTRAKVTHRGPHHLRHSCVSILLDRGMPLKLVANQVGDSIATLALHYAGAGDPKLNLPGPATQVQPGAQTFVQPVPELAVIQGGKA